MESKALYSLAQALNSIDLIGSIDNTGAQVDVLKDGCI